MSLISMAQSVLGFETSESSFVELKDGAIEGAVYLAGAKSLKEAKASSSPTFIAIVPCRTIKVGGNAWLQPSKDSFAELKACVKGLGFPVGTNGRTTVRFFLKSEDGQLQEAVRVIPARSGKRQRQFISAYNRDFGFKKDRTL